MKMEQAYEKMMRYCRVNTMSDDASDCMPTTERQFTLARMLADELRQIGVQDVAVSDACVVYGNLPATAGLEDRKAIGFIAHVDTVPDFCGENVCPRVIANYDGQDIPLPKGGRTIRVADFPHLEDKKGKTLITASGDTLLGADDKAGVAEIVSLCERLVASGEPHGKVCVAFTPDEEVGRGTVGFDLAQFGADYAYTLDGSAPGEVVYENFNAASAVVTVAGRNVHPGSAKDIMLNASLVAMEWNALLPTCETPAHTQEYEGFFHLMSMQGDVEQARLSYIVRDFDAAKLQMRLDTMRLAERTLNERYGDGTVSLEITMGYRNMREKIEQHPEVVDAALRATKAVGLAPIVKPIRGGTDGSSLTERGLPCPNLGTGGYGFHGPYEHVVAEEMELCVEVLLQLLREFRA